MEDGMVCGGQIGTPRRRHDDAMRGDIAGDAGLGAFRERGVRSGSVVRDEEGGRLSGYGRGVSDADWESCC